MIPFDTFKDKIRITKEYDGRARIEVIDNRYVYIEMRADIA